MGIADLRRALETGAAGKASISNVTLSYRGGGKKQLLRYRYALNKGNAGQQSHEAEFPGTDDPVAFALSEGQRLASVFDLME